MVNGLLLTQAVCFDQWKRCIPLSLCLPASWLRRRRGALQPVGALGDAAVATARPGLASGTRHHVAMEPILRRGAFRGLPWPSRSAALADA